MRTSIAQEELASRNKINKNILQLNDWKLKTYNLSIGIFRHMKANNTAR
jgi:hypothetical protein